ncbi:MAG: malto-oligosyltrehalose synthase [Acidimicrobiales bacterium]
MTAGMGSTYRLQLGPTLDFDDAAALVGHLASLRVENLYCSPISEAVPGSTHGYDGTDPSRLRAELGGEQGFRRLGTALAAAGIGCVVDIVPNHLSTWAGGPWWRAVLRDGRASELAEVFDVDWDAGAGKVLLPLLDRPLDEALAEGSVTTRAVGGEPVVAVGGTHLPVTGGALRPDEDVAEVLGAQHYRLVDWHDRSARNYRRFFDIDTLVGLHTERPEVFERLHALVGRLVADGLVTGLRVDHVDGLADPAGYLRRLAELTGGLPVVVEKILTGDETLRRSWRVVGTTGYEALDDIGGALVDPQGCDRLAEAAATEGEPDVASCATACRRAVASTTFAAELEHVATALGTSTESLVEVTVALPVYRTYLDSGPLASEDSEALAIATARSPGMLDALLDPSHAAAVTSWQQRSGAVMAKGVEDTAWYRLAGRLAFCEVGGQPARSRADGVTRLHARAGGRAASGEAGLVPGTTHDTKRSGDVRCRLYALSELAAPFEAGLRRYRELLGATTGPGSGPGGDLGTGAGDAGRAGAAARSLALTRLLAQTILAMLPAADDRSSGGSRSSGDDAYGELSSRIGAAMVKGEREAGIVTTWDHPDGSAEGLIRELVERSLARQGQLVRAAFGALVDDVARLGATLSLSAVLLRSTLPGAPDCYQGDEAWNLALVDPDNRRSVDFAALGARLAALGLSPLGVPGSRASRPAAPGPGVPGIVRPDGVAARCRVAWRTGDVKLLVTASVLEGRRAWSDSFGRDAAYRGVEPVGPASASVVACARAASCQGPWAVGIATRLPSRLDAPAGDLPAGRSSYGSTELVLPAGAGRRFVEACTGNVVEASGGRVAVAEACTELPVALLLPA